MEFPILKNSHSGVDIPITKSPFSIGRGLNCNYVIALESISRVHCYLELSKDGWVLRDSSSNGTYINGDLLTPKNSVRLKNDDIIMFSPAGEEYKFKNQILPVDNGISDEQLNLIADTIQEFGSSSTATTLNTSKTSNATDTSIAHGVENLLRDSSPEPPRSKRLRIDPTTTSNSSSSTIIASESSEKPLNICDNIETKTTVTNHHDQIEEMEDELVCSICSEMFVKATTLNCSHTFCKYCIDLWKQNKLVCPICRANITSQTPTLVLDNVIDKIIQGSTNEIKERRQKLLDERKEEEIKKEKERKNYENNRDRGRGRGRGRARGRRNEVEEVRPPERVEYPVINLDTESDSEDGDSYISTSLDDSASDSENWVEGVGRTYYGGYGRCYNCGRRGHWSNGCPYR